MNSSPNKSPRYRSGIFFVVLLCGFLVIYLTDGFRDNRITVGLLFSDEMIGEAESEAAFQFLDRGDIYLPKRIIPGEIESKPNMLREFDIIWIHRADSSGLPEQFYTPAFLNSVNDYIESGGRLLLTQEAFSLLNNLGFEDQPVQLDHAEAIDHGYGRKLGFHAFIEHPLFDELHGGAYVFNPYEDQVTRQRGFFQEHDSLNGKVIGIDWSYITFRENKKLILEYDKGKGKVLAIGAYILFNIQNHNWDQFGQFMNNALYYLIEPDAGETNYWAQESGDVALFQPVYDKVVYPMAESWKELPSELSFHFKNKSNEFWDLAGERMMTMGHEQSGIDEIWAHPFMAIRDYRAGIKLHDGRIIWLSEIDPEITITPASLTRQYQFDGIRLKEIISVHHDDPKTVVHYEFEGADDAKVLIGFVSNLRLMWPYSHTVAGDLKCGWIDGINSFIMENESGDFTSLVGMNRKPEEHIIGRYDSISYRDHEFSVNPTEKFQCGAMAVFQADHPLDVVIAASHFADPEAIGYLTEGLQNPYGIYKNAYNYYRGLLDDKLMITSPDEDLNTGYRWALVGTDRHFVNTPGVGKSLVAGIGNTIRGWWGGHVVNGRPGYAWYFGRDAEWSAFAINDYGDFNKVKGVLQMLIDYQHMNGKIFHELTTSGAVHYDAADATPLFIVLAGKYLRSSGDQEFIKRNWQAIVRAIDFCYSTDPDQDHLINNTGIGHGWVEGGFLFGGKTTLYLVACWAGALEEAAYMADIIGLNEESKKYKKDANVVTALIRELFRNDESSFYYHSINRDSSFIEEKTVMPAIPMYFEQLETGKVQHMLDEFASNNFTSNWGCRIVGEDSEHFHPRGYHTGSVWPLYTGWVALAEYKYGNSLQAYAHLMNNINVYKHWAKGFIEEVLHGAEYKPNGVCAHQCWSETMAIQPLIEGMLGIEADANFNTLHLSPAVPPDWHHYQVENIPVGENSLDYEMIREGNTVNYLFRFSGDEPLKLLFSPVYLDGAVIKEVRLDDELLTEEIDARDRLIEFYLTDKSELKIEYEGGISVLPLVQNPEPGDIAEGVRIISTCMHGRTYEVLMEAPDSFEADFRVISNELITSVENASILKRSGNIYELRTQFSGSEKYIRKVIRINTGKD